jgi:integrase
MRRRKEVGIRRKRGGWQVCIVLRDKFYSKQFDLNTPVTEMRAWRDAQVELHGTGLEHVGIHARPSGTFADDVATYLHKPEVLAMPGYRQRAQHLGLWVQALGGDRRRASITRDEIEAVLQGWLAAGLAAPTVYHRRTALQSCYVKLDGRDAPNPVRGTTRPAHYRPVDRSIPFELIERILAAMPAEYLAAQGIRRPSLAKLRCAVIAHTGIPPAELQKLRAHHFDRERAFMRMPWRDKGAGAPAHLRELSPTGVAAFVALDAAGGWGSFAPERLSVSFKRAARRVCGADTPIRLYDLRHSLAADLYRATRNLDTVARLLGHVPGSLVTGRYAMGAHAEVDRAAVAAVHAARRASVTPPPPPDSLPVNSPARRKSRKQTTLVAVR